MTANASIDRAVRTVTVCATAMIASQVGGKATRDALFLSTFDVENLPVALAAGALVSILLVLSMSRWMGRWGPFVVVPRAFALSALLLAGLAVLARVDARWTAVLVYLHVAAFGAVLISGFWSLVNERFDPRTARQRMGRIAGGGTFGGLLGGLFAERLGALAGIDGVLWGLALLHAACAILLWPMHPDGARAAEDVPAGGVREGLRVIRRVRYLRDMALLILLGTLGAACLDYVFKSRAAAAIEPGEPLLRFFAIFYTLLGLATFLVQAGLARTFLERLGLARTVATLPLGMSVGALGLLFQPGLVSATLARGAESMLRSSLFRSGYEPLYTPLPPEKKRASKAFIDVGAERIGDAVGGGLIRLVLFVGGAATQFVLVSMALALGLVGLWLSRRLHRGYVTALEKSLLSRAVELDPDEIQDGTTRTMVLQTLQDLRVKAEPAEESGSRPSESPEEDPELRRVAELRCGEAPRVLRTLALERPLAPTLVPQVIPLLAWDEVAPTAIAALREVADRSVGALLDALLDPHEEFAVRRRLPRVLVGGTGQRVVDGLLEGLADRRFEVRYQCGRALARLRAGSPGLDFPETRVYRAVLQEARVDRRVWESHRLLDAMEDADEHPFLDELLRRRSSRSLEHVFTLLALVLPEDPLRIAFRGLHTDDQALRGTALEYLESVLPSNIKAALWPFLDAPTARATERGREEILEDLLRSHQSIQINLEELRRRQGEEGGDAGSTPPPDD